MEKNENPTVKSVSIKWGIIGGFIGIIQFVVFDIAGLSGNQQLQWFGLIITLTLIILCHRAFKKEGDGFMSYTQGLAIGTLYSVISSLIGSVFVFLYVSFVNDAIVTMAREKAIMDMENSGQSDAQIEQAMSFVEMFTSPIAFAIIGTLMGVFFGFLISVIVSIFTKNQNPELI